MLNVQQFSYTEYFLIDFYTDVGEQSSEFRQTLKGVNRIPHFSISANRNLLISHGILTELWSE